MDITFLSGKNQEKIVYKELPNNSKKFIREPLKTPVEHLERQIYL